jgi:hypothetical protein
LRFGLPIRTAETLRRRDIPLTGILRIANGFEIASQFKGDHGIARFLKKRGELSGRIFASSRSSDACGDLLPVGHTCDGILTANENLCHQGQQETVQRAGTAEKIPSYLLPQVCTD